MDDPPKTYPCVQAGGTPALPGIAALRPEILSCCGVVNPTMRVLGSDATRSPRACPRCRDTSEYVHVSLRQPPRAGPAA